MNVNVLSPEQQARQLASQGQYRAAAGVLHVVLQQQPAASAWALWASLHVQLGDEGQAIEGYRHALNLCPSEQTWETCLNDLWKRQRLRKQAGRRAAQGHERLQQRCAAEASALLQEALQPHGAQPPHGCGLFFSLRQGR